jgi:beta-glucosidase
MSADSLVAAGRFAWAVGIEDTFVGHPHRRTGRVLDEYALIDHYARWRSDLDLVAGVGIRTMRYGIPWYRVEPEPGRFDWSWTDAVLDHLAGRLKIQPILDLVHYGTPLWLTSSFVDPDYPERVASYAAAVAERYRGLVHAFTPLNEPFVNAVFSGRNAAWPPYLRGDRGFARVLVAIADGMARTIASIRSVQPEAIIVTVDSADHVTTTEAELAPLAAWLEWLHHLATDLVLGHVAPGDAPWSWLASVGADEQVLDRLTGTAQQADVIGVNFYPHMSRGEVVRAPDGRPRRVRRYASPDDVIDLLGRLHGRYRRPLMLTETSDVGRPGRRLRWMEASVGAVRGARASGVPVVGYTWFPVFSHVGWDWRAGRRDVAAYWWRMGLWDVVAADDGRFSRRPTPLVARYASLVADGDESAGPLEATAVA